MASGSTHMLKLPVSAVRELYCKMSQQFQLDSHSSADLTLWNNPDLKKIGKGFCTERAILSLEKQIDYDDALLSFPRPWVRYDLPTSPK